ncbi:MAG: vWA domain-containing protein, partial [Planctomycetota bacterium]
MCHLNAWLAATVVAGLILPRAALSDSSEGPETHVMVVMDISPSMGYTSVQAQNLIAGHSVLINNLAFEKSLKAGQVNFTEKVEKVLPVLLLPNGRREIDELVGEFRPLIGGKGTNIALGLRAALKELLEARQHSSSHRLQAVVLLSDGDYNRVHQIVDSSGKVAWPPSGYWAEVHAAVQELGREGIPVYAVPITPRAYGMEPVADTEEQKEEMRRRWRAGHALLAQVSRETGGKCFDRTKKNYNWFQLYQRLRGCLTTAVDRVAGQPNQQSLRPRVLSIDRAVVIAGHGLQEVTLPSGTKVRVPTSGHVKHEDRRIEPLGTDYSYRRYNDVDVVILRRPPVESLLGDSPEQIRRRNAWVGYWEIRTKDATGSDVTFLVFTDLTLHWSPELGTRFWHHEVVPLSITYHSEMLRAESEAATSAAAKLLQNLDCVIELYDESGAQLCKSWIAARQRDGFSVRPQFDQVGRFELRITLQAGVEGEIVPLMRIRQPIVVEPQRRVQLSVIRTRDRASTQILGPSVQGIGPIFSGDRLTFRFEVDGNEWGITQFRGDTPGWLDPQGQPRPSLDSKPKQAELDFVVQASVHEVSGGDRPFEVGVLLQPLGNAAAKPRQLSIPVPAFPVSRKDTASVVALLESDHAQPSHLYTGEEGERRFFVHLMTSEHDPPRLSQDKIWVQVVKNDDRNAETFSVRASFDLARPIARIEGGYRISFRMKISPFAILEPGNYSFAVEEGTENYVAGQRVNGKRSFDVLSSPVEVNLSSTSSERASHRELFAHHALTAELKVLPRYHVEPGDALELHQHEGEAEDTTPIAHSSSFEMLKPNLLVAEIDPLSSSYASVYPVAVLWLRHPDESKTRLVRLHFPESGRRVVQRPFQIVAAAECETAKPTVGRDVCAKAVCLIKGGAGENREEAIAELHKLFRNPESKEFENLLDVVVDGVPALAPKSLRVVDVGPDGADPDRGAVTLTANLRFRVTRAGEARIRVRLPEVAGAEVSSEPSDMIDVGPSPYDFVLYQRKVNADLPLLDTRVAGLGEASIHAFPTAGLEVQLLSDAPEGVPDDLRATIGVSREFRRTLEPVTDLERSASGRNVVRRLSLTELPVGNHQVRFHVFHGNEEVVELGPFDLSVRSMPWQFAYKVGPPTHVPASICGLMGKLEI